ncbi:MAG: type II secretion system protein N [Pseudomonadota bacterium]
MKPVSFPGMVVLFIAGMLVSAVAALPLSLVLWAVGAPLEAERISGTIWNGRIENAWIAGYPAGDIGVSGEVAPLLNGRVAADLSVKGAIATGRASVLLGVNRIEFRSADLAVELSAMELRDAFGAPMEGLVRLKTDGLSLSREACTDGQLHFSTDTLQRTARRYGGKGFALAGLGRCEEGAFILPLRGEGEEGVADAMIRVTLQGYTTELTVVPADEALANALHLYGFQQQGDAYSLVQRGTLF